MSPTVNGVSLCYAAIALDGPLPRPPEHSLLATAGVLQTPGGDLDGYGSHWLSGATIYGYPEDTPTLWDPDSTGTYRLKSEASPFSTPTFASFAIYQPLTCSAMGIGPPQEFADRVSMVLEATSSFAVEQALSQGIPGLGNAYFLDGNESLPAGLTPQAPEDGLAYLEEAIGATGRQGMIHMPPAVVAKLGFNWLREEENEGPLTSNVGTPVISGGGYIGAAQINHTVSSPQSWCFATGPVEVRISDTIDQQIAEVLDRSNNDVTFRAERYCLATWDTALQVAVLVDWTL